MATFDTKDPTPEVVAASLAAGTGGNASAVGSVPKQVQIPLAASSTLVHFLNPEGTTIYATADVIWTTAGTGTFDLGTGSSGTGSGNDLIDGGTMAVGVISVTNMNDAASGSAGGNRYVAMGGSGSAGDTLILTHNEAATGTAVGVMVVTYITT